MRRADRAVTDMDEILDIVRRCEVCTLALKDAQYPYALPMSFGETVRQGALILYFHCAPEGKKLDLMRADARVAFEMHTRVQFVPAEAACNATMRYESACGTGILRMAEAQESEQALRAIMRHYMPGAQRFDFEARAVAAARMLRLDVQTITAKDIR